MKGTFDMKPPTRDSGPKTTPYLIPGFHAVRAALTKTSIKIEEIWIGEGKSSKKTNDLIKIATKKNIPVRLKKTSELSRLFPDISHQGVAAVAERFNYTDLEQIIEISRNQNGRALLIALDHITDEGNLGALIRTSSFFGAQGLIIPKDRSAQVTPKVLKRSSGACLSLPVARVVNMGRTLDLLDKKGFWIIGAADEATETMYQFDWNMDLVLALGNEERGLSPSVRNRCHQEVSIPSLGDMTSLNVSVAAGVFLSEIFRQRNRVATEL
jgi:23S rRNA (guanosine2251-2'-O)-methyltransferase